MKRFGSALALAHSVLDRGDVDSALQGQGRQGLVVTLAPWQLWLAARSSDYRIAVEGADATCIDGRALQILLCLAGLRYDRITGREIASRLYDDQNSVVCVLGGSDEACARIRAERPEWSVIDGDFSLSPLQDPRADEVFSTVSLAAASVVLVALGCPKQEYWGEEIARRFPVFVIGVGGGVDTAVGLRARPSGAVERLGLEWLQRTLQDPARFVPRVAQAASVLPVLFLEALALRWRTFARVRGR